MYAAIRRYVVEKGKEAEIARRGERDLLPLLHQIPGFIEYIVLETGRAGLTELSLYDSKESADASTQKARRWVRENLIPLVRASLENTTGSVLVRECNPPGEGLLTVPSPEREAARLARIVARAFNERNLELGMRHFHPDAETVVVGTGEVFHGPAGCREMMERWLRALPDWKTQIIGLLASDELAAVEYIGRGTHDGPLISGSHEIPGTGRHVQLQLCEVIRVHLGKIVRIDRYYDTASLLRQLGVESHLEPVLPHP